MSSDPHHAARTRDVIRRARRYLADVPVLVLACDRGEDFHELTETLCKAALPFAGSHRLVDWTLANVARSGLSRVTVATQARPHVLRDHLATRWSPVFSHGQFAVVDGPALMSRREGFRGTADALAGTLSGAPRLSADEVVVLCADSVCEMDLRPLLARHRAHGARATVAAHRVPARDAPASGRLRLDDEDKVIGLDRDPATGASGESDPPVRSMGIYVFDRAWLSDALRQIAEDPASRHDIEHDLLPLALEAGGLFAVQPRHQDAPHPFYWRDVGTLDAFREIHLELAASPDLCALPHRVEDGWLTMPAKFADGHGNALMQGASLSGEADVRNTILAPGLHVPAGVRIGHDAEEDAHFFRVTEGGTRLVTPEMFARYAKAHQPVHPAAAVAPRTTEAEAEGTRPT